MGRAQMGAAHRVEVQVLGVRPDLRHGLHVGVGRVLAAAALALGRGALHEGAARDHRAEGQQPPLLRLVAPPAGAPSLSSPLLLHKKHLFAEATPQEGTRLEEGAW